MAPSWATHLADLQVCKPSSGLEPETLLTMEVFDRLQHLAEKAEAR